jgi:hypothetical protein
VPRRCSDRAMTWPLLGHVMRTRVERMPIFEWRGMIRNRCWQLAVYTLRLSVDRPPMHGVARLDAVVHADFGFAKFGRY